MRILTIKKGLLFIVITGLTLVITSQGFTGQMSITGRVTKVDNHTITIETITADTIPEGSKVELFFEISEEQSLEIGQWKVSGRGKGVIYATPVDMIGPPQKGMTAKISYSSKKKGPVITSSTPQNRSHQKISRKKSLSEIVPEIRGKQPKGQLLGIPFPEKTVKEYAIAGDKFFKEKNYKMAVKEYEQCARMNHSGCQEMLGYFYSEGLGVKKNLKKAREFYEESAQQDNAAALYSLGVMYAKGHGVKKNMTKAYGLFLKSANLGYPEAQFNLGAFYYNGMGVKMNESTALTWFKKAADQNIPKALYIVGQAHELGWGTLKNMSKAKEYYKKAAKLGDKNAQEKIENLQNH